MQNIQQKQLLAIGTGLLLFMLFASAAAQAAAPLRSGQPYAEAQKCAAPGVIFCEDFNYPNNFYFSGITSNNNHRWINPGWAQEQRDFALAYGRQINPTTQYRTKPQGAMPSDSQPDYVWVANWDSTMGTKGAGSSAGNLRMPGGNYVNGMSPVKDFYVRFQLYWTSNYAWPGDPKTDKYGYRSTCIDNKILFIFPPEGLGSPASASYDAGPLTACGVWDNINNARFADALVFRVGDAGDNYKSFPMDSDATNNPQHMEYAPFQSLTLRSPNDTPIFGKIFRFNVDQWYTLEFRYNLSSSGEKNGTVEAWINGTKIYSASDLATCTNAGQYGDCSGLGALIITAYHNSMDTTAWNGQQVIDNLIISASYIGPPDGSTNPSLIAPPGNLHIVP